MAKTCKWCDRISICSYYDKLDFKETGKCPEIGREGEMPDEGEDPDGSFSRRQVAKIGQDVMKQNRDLRKENETLRQELQEHD